MLTGIISKGWWDDVNRTYYNNHRSLAKKKAMLDIENRLNWMVPRIYASIGLALYEGFEWEPEQIQELFNYSQAVWQSSTAEGWDMLDNAEEIVGAEFKRFADTGNIV